MNSNDGLVPSRRQTYQPQLLHLQTGSTGQHGPKAIPPPLMEGIHIHTIPISPVWPAAGVWLKINSCWLQPYRGFHSMFAGVSCTGHSPAVSGGKAACCIALSSRGRGLLDDCRHAASFCLCCGTLHLHVFQVDTEAEIIQTRCLMFCHSFSVAQAPWLQRWTCYRDQLLLSQVMVVYDDTQIAAVSTFAATQPGWAGSSEGGTKTRLMAAPILHSQSLWVELPRSPPSLLSPSWKPAGAQHHHQVVTNKRTSVVL